MAQRADELKELEELKKKHPAQSKLTEDFNKFLMKLNKQKKQKATQGTVEIKRIDKDTWASEGIEVAVKGDIPDEEKKKIAERSIRKSLSIPWTVVSFSEDMTPEEEEMEIYRHYLKCGLSPELAEKKAREDYEKTRIMLEIMDGKRPLPRGGRQLTFKKGKLEKKIEKGRA